MTPLLTMAGLVGGMGLVSVMTRKTLLGMIIGIQLLIIGSSMAFVLAGISADNRAHGHVFATFIALGGVAQLVAAFAVAIRLFYLRNRIQMEDLRSLKQ